MNFAGTTQEQNTNEGHERLVRFASAFICQTALRSSGMRQVDISENSVRECRSLVSKRSLVFQQDSVGFLAELVKKLIADNQTIDFLYLDSYDLDWNYWQPSAIHHLKELAIAIKVLRPDSLVVVDDCPLTADFIPQDNNMIDFFTKPRVGGKRRLVAEFADAVGAKCVFAKYQAGWVNLV